MIHFPSADSGVTSSQVSVLCDLDNNQSDSAVYVSTPRATKVSGTDISITNSSGSDILMTSTCTDVATNRKASSLGDLTRITPSANEDGGLERTVSLDFKPVASITESTSRAIYNLAVQDLSRVGEDSDEDFNLNRKRSANVDNLNLASVVRDDVPPSSSSAPPPTPIKRFSNRTILAVDTDGIDVNIRPLDCDSAEALWFGNRSMQISETFTTKTISYTTMDTSSADVTFTTSLGTSPSETSSSNPSPILPASPEPSEDPHSLTLTTKQVHKSSLNIHQLNSHGTIFNE